jgi:hypothetical protein
VTQRVRRGDPDTEIVDVTSPSQLSEMSVESSTVTAMNHEMLLRPFRSCWIAFPTSDLTNTLTTQIRD